MGKRRPSGEGMVRKIDGVWEGRIVAGHKANGKPIYRSVYDKTQKGVLEKLHRLIEEYNGVELTEESQITLGEWLDRWLSEYMPGTIREHTLATYDQYARNQIKPYLGDKKLNKITPAEVVKLYATLRERGRIHPDVKHGAGLSNTSIARIHAMFHHAMKTAVEEHLIAQNPLDSVPPQRPVYRKMRVFNEKEFNTFLAEIERDEAWRDFFYLELTTGLRRGEICALQWEDFDERAGTLRVSRSVEAMSKGEMRVNPPKTPTSIRLIYLPPSAAEMLSERKKAAVSEWIFPYHKDPNRPMNPNSAYRKFKHILQKAELPNIRFHDLRHTFATHAMVNGVDAKTLSGILGHTNASFTLDTYTHVTTDMQKRAAAFVGSALTDIMGEEL